MSSLHCVVVGVDLTQGFTKPNGDTILVATHVDDSIVTCSNDDKTETFAREMMDRFDGTCERNLTEMLGMEWERDIEAGTSILHQKAFTRRSC